MLRKNAKEEGVSSGAFSSGTTATAKLLIFQKKPIFIATKFILQIFLKKNDTHSNIDFHGTFQTFYLENLYVDSNVRKK